MMDGYNALYFNFDKSEHFNTCVNRAALSRLNTWVLAQTALYMLSPRYPKGNWGGISESHKEWIDNFLERVDHLLCLRNDRQVNDPIIAADFGGDEQLWVIRKCITRAREDIALDRYKDARVEVLKISRLLFTNAIDKFLYAIEDESHDPHGGVSTTRKQRELARSERTNG